METNTSYSRPEKQSLNPDQRRQTASRMLHAAGLIEGGAEISHTGGLQVTEMQRQELLGESIAEAHANFLEHTADGNAIAKQRESLNDLAEFIKPIGSARIRSHDPLEERRQVEAWVNDNALDINLQSYNAEDPIQLKRMQAKIDEMNDSLRATSLTLLEFPQLRLGESVSVMRNSQNGPYAQPGWKVEKILADGKLEVGAPNGMELKRVTPARLAAWNNLGEPSYTDAVLPRH